MIDPVQRVRVGFVGLGRMGLPMAGRLLEVGYDVTGYDVAGEARARLERCGGSTVSSIGELASLSETIVLMLPDSAAVAEVVQDQGFRAGLNPGTLLIDMSSSEPAKTRQLAAELEDRQVSLIDAPVSGGVAGAVAGSLTVMLGGSDEDVARAQPIVQHFGRTVRAGATGAGHAIKALNNLLSATHLWITSEAMIIGERFGLDRDVMLEIFNMSSGRSVSTEQKWPRFIVPETYDSGFTLQLMLKDMLTATQLADTVGVPAELGRAAVHVWENARAELPAEADHTEIARFLSAQISDSPRQENASVREVRTTSTARQEEIRERFVRERGGWGDVWEQILVLDPELLSAYLEFYGVPWRKTHLDAKTKELIALAVDVSVTHLYERGIREHIRAALDQGSSPEEVMEVIALTTTLGIHSANVGVPLLAEVLQEEGLRTGPAPLDDYQQRLKDEFVEKRGYWREFWDETLELDPELFDAYTKFSSIAGRSGALDAPIRELVCLAFNASTTHLYPPGIKLHIQNAIGLGATVGAVLETLEIASVMGFQSSLVGVPILVDELARQERGETP